MPCGARTFLLTTKNADKIDHEKSMLGIFSGQAAAWFIAGSLYAKQT